LKASENLLRIIELDQENLPIDAQAAASATLMGVTVMISQERLRENAPKLQELSELMSEVVRLQDAVQSELEAKRSRKAHAKAAAVPFAA
jgi:hypothetical protein